MWRVLHSRPGLRDKLAGEILRLELRLAGVAAMDERTLYIKSYKLDRQKIRAQFPKEDDDWEYSYEFRYFTPIIDNVPETAYKYVGCGVEPDGHDLNLVLVLEDGYDQAALRDVFTVPDMLPDAALDVLTPGIWPLSSVI